MKNMIRLSKSVASGLALFLFGAFQITAQETAPNIEKNKVEVQRYTVMEKFASEITPTAEEREQKKLAHLREVQTLKRALDTMDISRRKKRKILADLIHKPYSDRVDQAMALISFDDDEIIKD